MDLDEFSDDGLDDLNDSVLQELETKAIQLTQAQLTQAAPARAPSQRQLPSQHAQQLHPGYGGEDYGWGEDDDDLDTAEVTNGAGVPVGRPVVNQALRQQQQQQQQQQHKQPTSLRSIPPIPNPRWNPAIDPSNRSVPPIAASQRFQPQPSQFARPPLPQQRFNPSQAAPSQSGDVLSALQQRVRVLEAELNATRGEASIVRAKSTKAQLEHDEQVARLKKVNAEQMAKQERMVETALAAERSASTELQFLQRDMREVTDRAKRKDTGGTGTGGAAAAAGLATPKKTAKTWGFADGFDDMDMVASPSKGQGRGKNAGSVAANVGERTPSKGKRKRPVIDSPVTALETHTGDVVMSEDKPSSLAASKPPVVVAAPTAPFDFLPLVLDHGCFHQQPPTFDVFSRFFFPSDPGTSLASLIFEKLPLMGNPHRPMQLLVDFSELVIHLWGRCLEEQFWEPIKYLVSLVSFTLQLHTIYVAPLIVKSLFPTAQSTVYTVAETRLRMPGINLAASAECSFLEEHVDTTQVLSLLYTAALACATTPSETEFEYTALGLWKLLSLEFVLLLLTPKQRAEDIIGMLDLLASSSLPDSIGPVVDDKDPQLVAKSIIERVSAKLTEVPRPGTTAEKRRRLRLAALRTLISFARYPFGALQLASHDNALPRLVTCLSSSIDDLYDQPIPTSILAPISPALASALGLPQSATTPSCPSSSPLHRIISQCVLLLHTLLTDPRTSNAADIGQKLSLAHGGSQRYLLALGRLAFAEEDLVMEAGVEGEVVEAAHELLEMAVTPDEGEVVSEAFGA